jgi:hypothetical protein
MASRLRTGERADSTERPHVKGPAAVTGRRYYAS